MNREPNQYKAVISCRGYREARRFYDRTPMRLIRRVLKWRHHKPPKRRAPILRLDVLQRDGREWHYSPTWTALLEEALQDTTVVQAEQPQPWPQPLRPQQQPAKLGARCGPVTVTNPKTGQVDTWKPYTPKQVAAVEFGTVRRPRRERA